MTDSTAPSNHEIVSTDTELSWRDVLQSEKQKPYFETLIRFVEGERAAGKVIYPKNSDVFNALSLTPFSKVKVVILGQDPYHGPHQAHGLCFSVRPPTPPPPSLRNIFQELEADVGISKPTHGDLQSWAEQGVLLLNAVLTVEAEKAGSHANKGWETFTDRIIRELNDRREHLVFLLWGAYAQKKACFVDRARHLVLEAPHPSPLSAHRGFLGCRHFSKANNYLQSYGISPVEWALPPK